MVMRSTLRFEPVNCVVTIFAETGASVSVFNIVESESKLNVSGQNSRSRFRTVHGSLVLVGHRPGVSITSEAAIVFETPLGRTRACGVAVMEELQSQKIRVTVSAEDDDGIPYRFVLSCTSVKVSLSDDDTTVATRVSRCRSTAS